MFFDRETKKERERERVHPNGLEGALSLFCLVLNVRILCCKARDTMYILVHAKYRNLFDSSIEFIVLLNLKFIIASKARRREL